MSFDPSEAKDFLKKRAEKAKNQEEESRLDLLEKVKKLLISEFSQSSVEVYLVGSITRPFAFKKNSDIDIVLKNFSGDRFDLWSKFERALDRRVEIILYENCHFKEHVQTEGIRVI